MGQERRGTSTSGHLRQRASRAISNGVIRRLAFVLEGFDRLMGRFGGPEGPLPELPMSTGEVELLAVVANWRGPGPTEAEPLATCLRGLLAMSVRRMEIVVVTDRDEAAYDEIVGWRAAGVLPDCDVILGRWTRPATANRTVVIERWRPRPPYLHGHYLTWEHKRVFRRVARRKAFTHLLYLEDDMAFGQSNLDYWLAARGPLHERGLLPGFVRFERKGGALLLSDQSRSGQHLDGGPDLEIAGGTRTVRVSRRAYQAIVLLDTPLIAHHLERSNTRTPLRSNVLRWGVRERACAGEIFAPTEDLLGAILRPSDAPRPASRHAVLLERDPTGGSRIDPGALIEHLRPTASNDPESRVGTIPVDRF